MSILAQGLKIRSFVIFSVLCAGLVAVPSSAQAAGATCSGLAATITSSARIINGSIGADVIVVQGLGAHTVNSGAGNDVICGSVDNDTINSGPGNDTVLAGAGNDVINSGGGNDIIRGGSGSDNITMGTGNDVLYYTVDQIQGISTDTISDFNAAGAGADLIQIKKDLQSFISIGGIGTSQIVLNYAQGNLTGTTTIINQAGVIRAADIQFV
jgi:Ca2+-binding RTX toxin-like protein